MIAPEHFPTLLHFLLRRKLAAVGCWIPRASHGLKSRSDNDGCHEENREKFHDCERVCDAQTRRREDISGAGQDRTVWELTRRITAVCRRRNRREVDASRCEYRRSTQSTEISGVRINIEKWDNYEDIAGTRSAPFQFEISRFPFGFRISTLSCTYQHEFFLILAPIFSSNQYARARTITRKY